MNEKELQNLKNVLNNPEGLKFLSVLLRKLGAFDRGYNFQNSEKEIFKMLTKREQGLCLLDNCFKANFNKTVEIVEDNYKKEGD